MQVTGEYVKVTDNRTRRHWMPSLGDQCVQLLIYSSRCCYWKDSTQVIDQIFHSSQWFGKSWRVRLLWHRVRKIPWRKKWQPSPVFLPGKSHGQRSLVDYSPMGSPRVRHDLATKPQPRWIRFDRDQNLSRVWDKIHSSCFTPSPNPLLAHPSKRSDIPDFSHIILLGGSSVSMDPRAK